MKTIISLLFGLEKLKEVQEITVGEEELAERTSLEAAENIQEETAVITRKCLFTVRSSSA